MVEYEGDVPEDLKTVLFDPQTAGGLLISVADSHSNALKSELQKSLVRALEIGEVVGLTNSMITVRQ